MAHTGKYCGEALATKDKIMGTVNAYYVDQVYKYVAIKGFYRKL